MMNHLSMLTITDDRGTRSRLGSGIKIKKAKTNERSNKSDIDDKRAFHASYCRRKTEMSVKKSERHR